jgi:hypothetical protein
MFRQQAPEVDHGLLRCVAEVAILFGKRCGMGADNHDSREVTVTTRCQVGLVSDFARRMGVGPRSRLLEILVRLPGGDYGVLLTRRPTSFTLLLVDALAPSGQGGVSFLRKMRNGWGSENRAKAKKIARAR